MQFSPPPRRTRIVTGQRSDGDAIPDSVSGIVAKPTREPASPPNPVRVALARPPVGQHGGARPVSPPPSTGSRIPNTGSPVPNTGSPVPNTGSRVPNTGSPVRHPPIAPAPVTRRRTQENANVEGSARHNVFFVQMPPAEQEGISPMLLAAESFCLVVQNEEGHDEVVMNFTDEVAAYRALVHELNSKTNARLITYAGRSFILPRLTLIAMREGMPLGLVGNTGDKYASFTTRFNTRFHLDLSDAVTNYGAVQIPPLADIYAAVVTDSSADLDTKGFENPDMAFLIGLFGKFSNVVK